MWTPLRQSRKSKRRIADAHSNIIQIELKALALNFDRWQIGK